MSGMPYLIITSRAGVLFSNALHKCGRPRKNILYLIWEWKCFVYWFDDRVFRRLGNWEIFLYGGLRPLESPANVSES